MLVRRRKTPNPLLAPGGFDRLYQSHARSLLVFLARRVLDPDVALDLAAETFAKAFASRARFRGESDAEAAGWLYAIGRHQLSRYLRRGHAEGRALAKLGLEVPAMSSDEQARVEELADLAPLRAAVASGLEQISANHRDALQLRVVRELPYPEVARELGISEDTARARVSRGLGALATALEPHLQAKESMP